MRSNAPLLVMSAGRAFGGGDSVYAKTLDSAGIGSGRGPPAPRHRRCMGSAAALTTRRPAPCRYHAVNS